MFRKGTAPWQVVAFLYYVLRFKFVEKIPYLSEFLDVHEDSSNLTWGQKYDGGNYDPEKNMED